MQPRREQRTCIALLRGLGAAARSIGRTTAIVQIASAASTFSANSGSAKRAICSSRKYLFSNLLPVAKACCEFPETRTSATAIFG